MSGELPTLPGLLELGRRANGSRMNGLGPSLDGLLADSGLDGRAFNSLFRRFGRPRCGSVENRQSIMPITLLDIILIGVMLISALLAMIRGFMREILSIASWIIAAGVTLYAYAKLLPSRRPTSTTISWPPWWWAAPSSARC
jgi:hypothetical protein